MTIELRLRNLVIGVLAGAALCMGLGWQFGHSDISRVDPKYLQVDARYFEPTVSPFADDGSVRSPWYMDKNVVGQ